MDNYVYHRVVGIVTTLSMVTVYTLTSTLAMVKHMPDHPELRIYQKLGPRYNTVWNMIFLYMYGIMSLCCDISTIRGREQDVSPNIRQFRFKIFHEVIFPQLVAMIIFWPIYFYDRELVFPREVDILISPMGNFAFHGMGIIYVFWELVFLPENVPKRSDVKNTYMFTIHGVFFIVLMYTRFVDLGVWMYDIFTATEGTILFPIIMSSLFLSSNLAFYGQWYVKDYVWRLRRLLKVE